MSKDARKDSINKDYLVRLVLEGYYSSVLKVFELAAEQGGVRSYIIHLLFINGKMIFHEIVQKTGMSPRHVNRVLQDLRQ